MSNKLDRPQLVPGAIVMVGPCENPNGSKDHSWCDAIWRIEAATGDVILCRRVSKLIGYADVVTMRAYERTWWQAEHMLEAYNTATAETKAEYAAQIEAVTSKPISKKPTISLVE